MSEEVVYSLTLRGSDGKTYFANLKENLSWIQQRLGICLVKSDVANLQQRIQDLDTRMKALEQPLRMKRVVELLKNEDQGRTERWLSHRVPNLHYDDLWQLKQDCRIHSFVKGKTHLYILKEI